MSPGPSVAVGVLQQQALVAGQRVGVVVFHQAAHTHKQDLALQVEFRVLGGGGGEARSGGAKPVCLSLQNGAVSNNNSPAPAAPCSLCACLQVPALFPQLHPGDTGQACK